MQTDLKRPWRVSLIAWFFILWSLLSLIPKVMLVVDPEIYRLARELNQINLHLKQPSVPGWFQLTHAFLGVPVMIVSGVGLLQGRMWALGMCLLWLVSGVVLTWAVTGVSMSFYLKLATTIVIALVLLRPKTFSYFSSRAAMNLPYGPINPDSNR
jgi:hypothetical protein